MSPNPHDTDADGVDDRFETILALALGVIAASMAKKVVAAAWTASTGRRPPLGPGAASASPAVLMLWGAAAGAAVGAARSLADRQAGRIAAARRAR